MSEALFILGDQLFPSNHYKSLQHLPVFMCEDLGLCTHYRYHKQKIVLFLASMRHFKEDWKGSHEVEYSQLPSYFFPELEKFKDKHQVKVFHSFEVIDSFFRKSLSDWMQTHGVKWVVHLSPAFMNSSAVFQAHIENGKKPFMKRYYELVRRESGILMEKGSPVGGKFSFDEDNRRPYRAADRKTHPVPKLKGFRPDSATESVIKDVEKHFPDHPGEAHEFAYPVKRSQALAWLKIFLDQRFENFGPFEDAIVQDETVMFHSLLSPLINMGMLTPEEVIRAVILKYSEDPRNLPSAEGFVRQLMGWREFIRGIYDNYEEEQTKSNFFKHTRKMKPCWYQGNTGIPVLDETIKKVLRRGYCHHIERLMVLSNLMLLCRIDPKEVHSWFMELFVDSADWVMGPNVYGMGQMSDGGIFATKPYICGSNYLLKMSDFPKGEWCEVVDGLYWSFIRDHLSFFQANPRLGMMAGTLKKMDAGRKALLFAKAEQFIDQVSYEPRTEP